MDYRVGILRILVVGEPLSVGRPGIIEDLSILSLIDGFLFLVVDVDIPKAAVFVGPGQLLTVGRPNGGVLETLVAAGDLLLFAHPVLGSDVEFVFTAAVGDVDDPAAIGRPGYR